MALVPVTSATLLKDLASLSSPRWSEFVDRYRPMMEIYLGSRFPAQDIDETIQETLVALARILPGYDYDREEKGPFHNYLTGILRHKAMHLASRAKRRLERESDSVFNMPAPPTAAEQAEAAWRRSLLEVALRGLLSDASIQSRSRAVFRAVAVNGEKPESVAARYGITRNSVDQIRSRLTIKLREIVRKLEQEAAA